MPIVFSRNTGKVIAIPDKVAEGSFSLGNVTSDKITYTGHKSIITRIGLSASGNYQFLHTIGNDVYVYVFGDRMGQIQIHGISFQGDCTSGGGGIRGTQPSAGIGTSGGNHGFELLYAWYEENRLAARLSPVDITIGTNTTFSGFVTALTGTVQDPLHRTIEFTLTIATLPGA